MGLEQDLELEKLEKILSGGSTDLTSYIKPLDELIKEKTTDDYIFFKTIYTSLSLGIPKSNEVRLSLFRKYSEKLRKYEEEEK